MSFKVSYIKWGLKVGVGVDTFLLLYCKISSSCSISFKVSYMKGGLNEKGGVYIFPPLKSLMTTINKKLIL